MNGDQAFPYRKERLDGDELLLLLPVSFSDVIGMRILAGQMHIGLALAVQSVWVLIIFAT